MASKDAIKHLTNKEFTELYRNLYSCLAGMNLMDCKKETSELIDGYVDQIRRKVLYEMKYALDEKDKDEELKRTTGIERLKMAVPKGNIELLLCLSELVKLSNKIHTFNQATKT